MTERRGRPVEPQTPEIIERVLAQMNGIALADALGLSKQAVYQWDRVPATRVLDVERLTGISRHELRPDLFGPPT